MAAKTHLEFFNGLKMPIIGYGTYQGGKAEDVTVALEAGYRHIDTAFLYVNESEVGKAIKKWIEEGKGKREDLFITTKLPWHANRSSDVEKFLKKSLDALQLDYVDLYLVHWPVGLNNQGDDVLYPLKGENLDLDPTTDLEDIWQTMEKQVTAGRTKSIGISNYNEKQIERTMKVAKIQPANLQTEMHLYHQEQPLRDVCKKNNITICAYAPLAAPATVEYLKENKLCSTEVPSSLDNPVVVALAAKKGKTPAQIILRFLIQQGVSVIPKSSNPQRIKENIDIFDFELNSEEVQQLVSLDKGEAFRLFSYKSFRGAANHPEFPF